MDSDQLDNLRSQTETSRSNSNPFEEAKSNTAVKTQPSVSQPLVKPKTKIPSKPIRMAKADDQAARWSHEQKDQVRGVRFGTQLKKGMKFSELPHKSEETKRGSVTFFMDDDDDMDMAEVPKEESHYTQGHEDDIFQVAFSDQPELVGRGRSGAVKQSVKKEEKDQQQPSQRNSRGSSGGKTKFGLGSHIREVLKKAEDLHSGSKSSAEQYIEKEFEGIHRSMNVVSIVHCRPLKKREQKYPIQLHLADKSYSTSTNKVVSLRYRQRNYLFPVEDLYMNPEYKVYDSQMEQIVIQAMEHGTKDSSTKVNSVQVFLQGQATSGKTSILKGYKPSDPIVNKSRPSQIQNIGLITTIIDTLFAFIEESYDKEYLLNISYLQVHNEQIKDLLKPTSVNDEVELVTCSSSEQVKSFIRMGNSNRSLGSGTCQHFVLRFVVESIPRGKCDNMDLSGLSDGQQVSCQDVQQTVIDLVELGGVEMDLIPSQLFSSGKVEHARLDDQNSRLQSLLLTPEHRSMAEFVQYFNDPSSQVKTPLSKLVQYLHPILNSVNNKLIFVNCVLPIEPYSCFTYDILQNATNALKHYHSDKFEPATSLPIPPQIIKLKRSINQLKNQILGHIDQIDGGEQIHDMDVMEKVNLAQDLQKLQSKLLTSAWVKIQNHKNKQNITKQQAAAHNRRTTKIKKYRQSKRVSGVSIASDGLPGYEEDENLLAVDIIDDNFFKDEDSFLLNALDEDEVQSLLRNDSVLINQGSQRDSIKIIDLNVKDRLSVKKIDTIKARESFKTRKTKGNTHRVSLMEQVISEEDEDSDEYDQWFKDHQSEIQKHLKPHTTSTLSRAKPKPDLSENTGSHEAKPRLTTESAGLSRASDESSASVASNIFSLANTIKKQGQDSGSSQVTPDKDLEGDPDDFNVDIDQRWDRRRDKSSVLSGEKERTSRDSILLGGIKDEVGLEKLDSNDIMDRDADDLFGRVISDKGSDSDQEEDVSFDPEDNKVVKELRLSLHKSKKNIVKIIERNTSENGSGMSYPSKLSKFSGSGSKMKKSSTPKSKYFTKPGKKRITRELNNSKTKKPSPALSKPGPGLKKPGQTGQTELRQPKAPAKQQKQLKSPSEQGKKSGLKQPKFSREKRKKKSGLVSIKEEIEDEVEDLMNTMQPRVPKSAKLISEDGQENAEFDDDEANCIVAAEDVPEHPPAQVTPTPGETSEVSSSHHTTSRPSNLTEQSNASSSEVSSDYYTPVATTDTKQEPFSPADSPDKPLEPTSNSGLQDYPKPSDTTVQPSIPQELHSLTKPQEQDLEAFGRLEVDVEHSDDSESELIDRFSHLEKQNSMDSESEDEEELTQFNAMRYTVFTIEEASDEEASFEKEDMMRTMNNKLDRLEMEEDLFSRSEMKDQEDHHDLFRVDSDDFLFNQIEQACGNLIEDNYNRISFPNIKDSLTIEDDSFSGRKSICRKSSKGIKSYPSDGVGTEGDDPMMVSLKAQRGSIGSTQQHRSSSPPPLPKPKKFPKKQPNVQSISPYRSRHSMVIRKPQPLLETTSDQQIQLQNFISAQASTSDTDGQIHQTDFERLHERILNKQKLESKDRRIEELESEIGVGRERYEALSTENFELTEMLMDSNYQLEKALNEIERLRGELKQSKI